MTFDDAIFDSLYIKKSGRLNKRALAIPTLHRICVAQGESWSNFPSGVDPAVARYIQALEQAAWSSRSNRAEGLRVLALAAVASQDMVPAFQLLLAEAFIKKVVPRLLREAYGADATDLAAADRCEKEGSWSALLSAYSTAKWPSARYLHDVAALQGSPFDQIDFSSWAAKLVESWRRDHRFKFECEEDDPDYCLRLAANLGVDAITAAKTWPYMFYVKPDAAQPTFIGER